MKFHTYDIMFGKPWAARWEKLSIKFYMYMYMNIRSTEIGAESFKSSGVAYARIFKGGFWHTIYICALV